MRKTLGLNLHRGSVSRPPFITEGGKSAVSAVNGIGSTVSVGSKSPSVSTPAKPDDSSAKAGVLTSLLSFSRASSKPTGPDSKPKVAASTATQVSVSPPEEAPIGVALIIPSVSPTVSSASSPVTANVVSREEQEQAIKVLKQWLDKTMVEFEKTFTGLIRLSKEEQEETVSTLHADMVDGISKMGQKLASLEPDWDRRFTDQADAIQRIDDSVSSLDAKTAKNDGKIALCEDGLTEFDEKLRELKDVILPDIATNLSGLKTDVDAVKHETAAMEAKSKSLIDDLKGLIDKDKTAKDTALSAMDAKITAVEEQAKAAETARLDLTTKLDQKIDQNHIESGTRVDAVVQENAALRSEIAELRRLMAGDDGTTPLSLANLKKEILLEVTTLLKDNVDPLKAEFTLHHASDAETQEKIADLKKVYIQHTNSISTISDQRVEDLKAVDVRVVAIEAAIKKGYNALTEQIETMRSSSASSPGPIVPPSSGPGDSESGSVNPGALIGRVSLLETAVGLVEARMDTVNRRQEDFEENIKKETLKMRASVKGVDEVGKHVNEIDRALTIRTNELGEKIKHLEGELGKKTSEFVANVSELKTEIGQNKSSVEAQISNVSRETAKFRREANDAIEGLTKSVGQMQVVVDEARAASSKPTSSLGEAPDPGVPVQSTESLVLTSSHVAAIAPPVVPPAMPDPSITPSSLPAPPDSSPSPAPVPSSVPPGASVSTGTSPGDTVALTVEDPSSSAASLGSDEIEKDQSFMSKLTIDAVIGRTGIKPIASSLRNAYYAVFGYSRTFDEADVKIAMGRMKYPVLMERREFPTELSPGIAFDHLWFTGGGVETLPITSVMRRYKAVTSSISEEESKEKAWTCILAQFLSFDSDVPWAKGAREQFDSDPENP